MRWGSTVRENKLGNDKEKVINIGDVKNKSKGSFTLKVLPLIINGEMREYVFICHVSEDGYKMNTVYTGYFFDRVLGKSLKTLSINTKKNFHGTFIVLFLNYIFYQSDEKICDISELKLKNIEEFLVKYSQGKIGRDLKRWKSDNVALKAGDVITRFCYWLVTARRKDKKLLFNMKYLKKSDFEISEAYRINKYTGKKEVFKVIKRICDYEITRNNYKREKVTRATLYIIKSLLEIAKANDPMMMFPIVLGAFVGLRQGEVTQMHRGRVITFNPNSVLKDCYIDLKQDAMLRDDGKYVGNIKVKRNQPIYPVFLPILDKFYKRHLKLLTSIQCNTHIHGALFIDENNKAMTYHTYEERFQALVEILKINLLELSVRKGDVDAIQSYEILTTKETRLTHHSLRHFYTHEIDRLEKNLITIQYYRGDKSMKSQEDYKGNMASIEGIKMVQSWFYSDLKKLGWDNV